MKPKKYSKLPVIIEAFEFDGSFDCAVAIKQWARPYGVGNISAQKDEAKNITRMHIHTKEGMMEASPGDFIIKGIKNEFYPCKPDIFEKTYKAEVDE